DRLRGCLGQPGNVNRHGNRTEELRALSASGPYGALAMFWDILVDDGVRDRDHAESDSQCADRGRGERTGAHQSTNRDLRVAAPIAVAPPRDRGAHAFARTVAQRGRERAHPDEGEARDPTAAERVA